MPRAREVNPGKWSEKEELFDNGIWSVIYGQYEQDPGEHVPAMGFRWNGDPGWPLGSPNAYGNPTFEVIPEALAIPVLHGLLDQLARHLDADYGSQPGDYRTAILNRLQRCYARQRETLQHEESPAR